jgi:hypothetical protein
LSEENKAEWGMENDARKTIAIADAVNSYLVERTTLDTVLFNLIGNIESRTGFDDLDPDLFTEIVKISDEQGKALAKLVGRLDKIYSATAK